MNAPAIPSTPTNFNFFPGNWQVHHSRLKQRLVGSTDWEEFGGTRSVQTLLGGFGNVDDNVIELPGAPYRAVTFRSYNPATQQWTIWWLDGRAPGKLDAPMVGSFTGGVGTFYGDDTLDGQPIRLRFLWSMAAPDVPCWEQAFSTDGGATWETNWTMTSHRAA